MNGQTSSGSILMISLHGYVAAEPDLGKPDTGGQVVFVLELAKQFSRMGYQIDIVTRQFEDQPVIDRINRNLRILRIPFGGAELIRKEDMHDHLADFITNLLAEIRCRNLTYDVINSHYWDAGWAGQRAAERLQIPHVHTPHSLGWWKRNEMTSARQNLEKTYRFEERIGKEQLIYRACDQVIATSRQQVEIVNEEYGIPLEQITMIPPGIDDSRYTPVNQVELKKIRGQLGFEAADVYCVGRAATNKGIDLLIQALPPLLKLVPEARLQLAMGANSKRDRERVAQWKALAQNLGVTDRIHWHGYVPDELMADYYRAAGVFALPSRYEPFGMTAIEAMACGTPSVITVHGGLHEAIEFGAHALYANPKRPEEFAAMLSMPMRYPALRETLANHGSRFARRDFGWKSIARRNLTCLINAMCSKTHYNARPKLRRPINK